MINNKWEFKKSDFKVSGQVAYAGYLCGEFQGYYHKERQYQLTPKRTIKGTAYYEKFIGWGMQLFHKVRNEDNSYPSWEDFRSYHKNFVNEIVV